MTQMLDDTVADLRRANAELQQRLDESRAERDEALEQQTATAEVLQVINSSPGDLGPVFDAMLEKAMRLCEASFGEFIVAEGERVRAVAVRGAPASFAELRSRSAPPTPGSIMARVLAGELVIHTADAKDDDLYRRGDPHRLALVDLAGARTTLAVTLVKDGAVLGAIHLYRQEVRTFSDKQIALLQNFAAQAVIAMENARLITETREALEQQTATAEVLGVINSSPGDLGPVFDAILEKALRLCQAAFGNLRVYDGKDFRPGAMRGLPPRYAAYLATTSDQPAPGSGSQRALRGENVIRVIDLMEEERYRSSHPYPRALVDLGGARSSVVVALRKDSALLGTITIYRQEVRPFTDKQIALLENFAAQAVVAMENARLITETREALEQQTATAEVLQVINSSPGDLTPVFDAMLEKATRLCEAQTGHLLRFENGAFSRAASLGIPEEFDRLLPLNTPMPDAITRDSVVTRLLTTRAVVHVHDLREDESYRVRAPAEVAAVEQAGIRTGLCVPMLREADVVGAFLMRRQEVRPFTDKQIALLQNFAAQAVIAMENARLITETREALEQQTATAEVLQVINSSPGDLVPVFDAILNKAHDLCGAELGVLLTYDGDYFWPMAAHGASARFMESTRQGFRPGLHNPFARVLRGEQFVQIGDIAELATQGIDDPELRIAVEIGIRTFLIVPLRKDDRLLGAITANRREVRPFTGNQIALLQNFAAQAVIAIENARLLTETREALEQQTATTEVLQVINSSPGNLQPVFDAMLDKALGLCGADFGVLWTYDGELVNATALRGVPPTFAEFLTRTSHPVRPDNAHGRLLRGEPVVHIADVAEDEAYRSGDPIRRTLVELGGGHTLLAVPLRKDGTFLGDFVIYRQEIQPFSDKQIALLQNFAAQAVIAMENARLITETREALEQQTATADVLQVINASPGNLTPVFDAMLEKATVLCGAAHGNLWTYDGERFHPVATHGSPGFAQWLSQSGAVSPAPGSLFERMVRGERFVQIADAANDNPYLTSSWSREVVEITGARTVLVVPLRKDRALLGAIFSYRQEVRPFTDKEVALLENFAAQAVIAMENARLITETREALEQQTATAEVLQVINSSPGDLAPVFDVMLEKAMHLCSAAFGVMTTYDGETFRTAAHRGLPPRFAEYADALREGKEGWGGAHIRMVEGADVVHLLDAKNDQAYPTLPSRRALVDLGGARTVLAVAMRRDDALLGSFAIYRQEVQSFSDKEISVLRSFAAQAVIAIENARLLGELQARTDELAQRQAELRVTFDNMADGVAMFDEDLRLAASNRNFQQIADLPEALLAERPTYADYLRILTERGELDIRGIDAELSSRLEDTDQELRLERTRPNGRVIEVRRNAVSDGGFVLIYSDITERKRSEAEIRAARDAAEAAYRDLKAAQANLIQAEKMASLGQLTAGIAHEIKNPLNFVNNFAGLSVELLDELKETAAPGFAALGNEKRAEADETITMLTGNLEKIAEHGRRADNIVNSMLEHSRGSSGERRSVDLNGLIEDALNLAYHGARAQDQTFNVTLQCDFGQGITPIELVPQDITRVCLNLLGNGFYAATKRRKEGSDPTFQPILKVTTRDLGDAVEIRVRDNGTGIAPEIKDKLFQPFFTTKPTGEGTGLGLSISYDILTQGHGGTIEVDSKVGEFTEFTIRLPRSSHAANTGAAA